MGPYTKVNIKIVGVKLMKMLVFLSLVFGLCGYAGAEETFTYSQSMECYVKSYENRVFKFVDDDYFVGKPLKIAELKRTPDFVAFKVNGKMYLAPKKCFTANEAISEDVTFEAMAYEEKNEKPVAKYKKALLVERQELAHTKKYFVELMAGLSLLGSSKNVVSDYATFIGSTIDGESVVSLGRPEQKKLKSELAFGGKFGWHGDSDHFSMVQFKKFSTKKTESLDFEVTPSGAGVLSLPWKFSIGQLYGGYSFCVSCKSQFGFYINTLLGLNFIDAELEGSSSVLKFSSTTPGGEISANLTYDLLEWLSISSVIGYDLQLGGTYKLKDSNGEELNKGFKSDISFGGPVITIGLRGHF